MNLFNNEIKFMHFRQFQNGKATARGGMTIAYYERDGIYTWAGALCSRKDFYSRHTGRTLAVSRLRRSSDIWAFESHVAFRETVERCVKDQYGYDRQFGKRKNILKNETLNVHTMSANTEGLTAN